MRKNRGATEREGFRLVLVTTALLFACIAAVAAAGPNQMQLETIRKIKSNELTFGSWVYLQEPAVSEMMARSGFDWLILDNEHGHLNENIIQTLIMSLKGTKTVPIARVHLNEVKTISKMLSVGPMGLMVPFVSTREDAQAAADAVFYPPKGKRDIGHARATGWGQIKDQDIATANDRLILIFMIETPEGVENIEEILNVPGVGAVLCGTTTLSGEMGLPNQWNHPKVVAAKEKVEAAAKARGIPYLSWANDRAGVVEAIRSGSRMVALGGDADFIWTTSERLLKLGEEVAGEMGLK